MEKVRVHSRLGVMELMSYTEIKSRLIVFSADGRTSGKVMSKRSNIPPTVIVSAIALVTFSLFCLGCAKRIGFSALPPARSGKALARIELTYNRNDSLVVTLSGVPDPATIKSSYTCYVLWVSTPDRKSISNAGRIQVDNGKASLTTLTPQRKFLLLITAESSGDVTSPGSDILFQTKEISW